MSRLPGKGGGGRGLLYLEREAESEERCINISFNEFEGCFCGEFFVPRSFFPRRTNA